MRLILLIIYALMIVVLAIVSLVVMSITALIDIARGKERRLTLMVSYVVARSVYWLSPLWRVKVEGRENFPTDKSAYVITANHQSFFDIPLMFFLPVRRGLNFVSKVEVRKIPAIGWMLGLRGDIVIRRGSAAAAAAVMEQGGKHLSGGTSVIIFPEGTRSKDSQVHLFKEGAFRLAQESGVAIVPCVIDGTPKLLTKRGLQSRTLTLRILPTITPEEVAGQSPREVARKVQQLTADNLAQIRQTQKK